LPVRRERREVTAGDPQSRACPQAPGGVGEGGIDLDAARVGDRLGREDLAEGGEERAGADGRIKEGRGARPAPPQLSRVVGDLEGEGGRRGELPEAVAVGGGPRLVEASLRELPLCLGVEYGQRPTWSRSLM
jgi:hypothetical protein